MSQRTLSDWNLMLVKLSISHFGIMVLTVAGHYLNALVGNHALFARKENEKQPGFNDTFQ